MLTNDTNLVFYDGMVNRPTHTRMSLELGMIPLVDDQAPEVVEWVLEDDGLQLQIYRSELNLWKDKNQLI